MAIGSKISPGKIYQIHEVLKDTNLHHDQSLRVTGSLIKYDATDNQALIEWNGAQMLVDTGLLSSFDFRISSLFQFIGETYVKDNAVVLRARVGRNVDGLDMKLFEEALAIRRKFIHATMAA